MAYPLVHITNSTPYQINGTVQYASSFCGNDDYRVEPNRAWTARSRGICLLTKITAIVNIGGGRSVTAVPYESSGTSYSQYAIVQAGPEKFIVTRITNSLEAPDPDRGEILYPEPVENQK